MLVMILPLNLGGSLSADQFGRGTFEMVVLPTYQDQCYFCVYSYLESLTAHLEKSMNIQLLVIFFRSQNIWTGCIAHIPEPKSLLFQLSVNIVIQVIFTNVFAGLPF